MPVYNDRPDAERYRYLRSLAEDSSLEAFVSLNQLDFFRDIKELDTFIDYKIKEGL